MNLNEVLNPFFLRIKNVLSKFPEYRITLIWFIRDIFAAYPWAMIRMAAMAISGAALQGIILLALVRFIRYVEADKPVSLGYLEINVRSFEVLAGAATILVFLLLLSALLLYLSGVTTSRIIARYHAFLLKRSITLFGASAPEKSISSPSKETMKMIAATALQDTQKAVFMIRFLSTTLSSLIMLFYSLPIILYIDASLTVLLMVLATLFIPFFCQANFLAYKSDQMLKDSAKSAKKNIINLMNEIKDYQYISANHDRKISQTFAEKELNKRLQALPSYFLSIARTQFLTNLLLGVSLGLVMAIKLPQAIEGEIEWALLMAYIIFLRLTVNSLQSIMLFLIKFSRFYPYIQRYQRFVVSSRLKKNKKNKIIIRCSGGGIWEKKQAVALKSPLLVSLYTTIPLNRYTFPYIINPSSKTEGGIIVSPGECFFVKGFSLPQKDGSLRDMINLPDYIKEEDLELLMPSEIYNEIIECIGKDPDKQVSEKKWGKLSLANRVEISVVSALLSPAKVVILEKHIINSMNSSRKEDILFRMRIHNILTIVNYPLDSFWSSSIGCFGEDLCAVTNSTGNIIALGRPAWIQYNKNDVQQVLLNSSKDYPINNIYEDYAGLEEE